MDEQILFLSRMEFAVLLLVRQITEIICFPLPEGQNVDKEQMIEAIYELICMGCLEVDGTLVKWTDLVKNKMEAVQHGELCLLVEPGNRSLPQKICYIGERVAVLENVQKEGKSFRFFSMDRKDFWKWLDDSIDIPETVLEERKEAEQLLEFNELVRKERELLSTCVSSGSVGKISEWMNEVESRLEETPYVGIRCIRRREQTIQLDLLICHGAVNTWFLWHEPENDIFLESSEKEAVHVELDSAVLRQEIWNLFWRNK